MEIRQNIKEKRYIIIVALVVIVLLSIAFLYFRKTDISDPIEETEEQETIIQEQLRELDAIREERRGGEEYIPLTEEEIQLQINELDSIRRTE